MSEIRISLLGRAEVTRGDGSPVHVPRRKALALLTYLAMAPGEVHPRDKLAALLWGDRPNDRARHSLRQALATLRAGLAVRATLLLERGDDVTLEPALVDVDVARFERLAASDTAEALAEVAHLYRGELAEGLKVSEPAFEEWLVAQRVRLRETAVEALTRLLAQQMSAAQSERAILTALRLLELDPPQETFHRTLMRLYAGQGRRGAALRQYETCQRIVRRELGAELEPETRALYLALLQQEPSPATAAGTPGGAVGLDTSSDAPLIGRATALARLRRLREQAWAGAGRLVVVAGEAGIGKSRLVAEGVAEAQGAGGRVLVARAYEGEQLPFGLWADALRGGGLVAFARESPAVGDEWRRELGRLFPELVPAGLPPPGAEDHVRLFEAAAILLRAAATGARLVVVLEDLHWADEPSLRLLAFLARRLAGATVLLVATVRDEEVAVGHPLRRTLAALDGDGRLARVDLAGLGQDDTAALVHALAPSGLAPVRLGRLGAQVWTVSGGNPLVILESMRALAGADTPPEDPLALPTRVKEITAARIDRLPRRSRGLLALAAVIGRAFDFALLEQAAGGHPRETAEAIEELVGCRLLHVVDERLDFTHERVRQVAYERILPGARAALHRAIGEALECLYPARLDDVADQLGLHYGRAGVTGKAIVWLVRYAELATQRYALPDAVAALEQATGAAERLPAIERDRTRLDLLLRRALVMSLLARQREILDLLETDAGLPERVGDPLLAAEYHFRVAFTAYYLGDYARSLQAAGQGLREAERAGDDERSGKNLHVLALTCYALGRPRDGIGHGTRAVRHLERAQASHWRGLASYSLGVCYLMAGDLDAAIAAHERCRTIGAAAQDPRLEAFGGHALAWAQILRGDLDEALRTAGRAVEVARDPLSRTLAVGMEGYARLERGEPQQAVILLELATRQLGGAVRQSEVRYTAFLAEAYALAGAHAQARQTVERALEMARADGLALNVGYAERARGRITRVAGAVAEAAGPLERALEAFGRSQAALEEAITRVDLAGILAAGAPDVAREHLDVASRIFEAAGAPRRAAAARAYARRAGLGLPTT